MGPWAAALVATWLGAEATPPCGAELFRVTRNTNANVVAYEARIVAPGRIDPGDPVHPVWLMLAEDGHREELNLLESAMAYGVETRPADVDGAVVIAIRARPELAIRVEMDSSCPVAWARVAGREARLRRVAVEATGGLFPGVAHLDLVGVDRETGAEVRERIVPGDR